MAAQKQNIYAFIDSQNLNLGVQNDVVIRRTGETVKGWKLDFKKFYIYLKEKHRVDKAFLFIGKIAGNEGLYQALISYGYNMIFKPTLEFSNDKEKIVKGNVDAELVLHAMIEYEHFDKAIIVSGDGDYRCLIQYLKENDKLLHVLIPNRYKYSSLLREFYDDMIFVSDLRNKLAYH